MTKLTPEQSKLVEDNHQLIYSFIHKNKLNIDDWYDICALALVRAAKAYEPDKGEFSTLTYTYMRNEMIREFKRNDLHFPETLSLDHEYENNKDGDVYTLANLFEANDDVEGEVVSRVYIEEMKKFFDENLKKDNHKKVIDLIFQGMTKDEASKEVGISRERFDQVIDNMYLKCVRKLDLYYINHGKRRKKLLDVC